MDLHNDRAQLERPVSPAAQRMMAQLLGRQLGMDASELASSLADDPVATMMALSMMGQGGARGGPDASEIVARVAVIVGACARCLGDDANCSACRGLGRPGSRVPDLAGLLEWLELPLLRVGRRITKFTQEGDEE
jgi:hypothetical protein